MLHKLLPSIYKYAEVGQWLYSVILRENAAKKSKAIMWDGEHEEAFWRLKEILTSTLILAYTDFSKPFKLHTDACTLGLGAILYQNQEGIGCVILHYITFIELAIAPSQEQVIRGTVHMIKIHYKEKKYIQSNNNK